jgi:uncharacterized membrane protein YeiH
MKLPYFLELLAVGVFAVSGCLAAGRKAFDPVGVVVISVVTAVGGGTVRDLLLGRHPIAWTADPNYLYTILASVAFTVAYVRFRPPPNGILLIADGIGLSVYAIVGAQLAEDKGCPAVVAVAMGAVTGTAGGTVRDILCNDVPILFTSGYLYATAAVLGATLYVGLEGPVGRDAAAYTGMAVVGALRAGAIVYHWDLPRWKLDDWASP